MSVQVQVHRGTSVQVQVGHRGTSVQVQVHSYPECTGTST